MEKSVLMTVNFTENYINPKLGAILFASDSLGNVIADTTFKGNGKAILYAKPGIKIPSRFMFTIATWEPSMHNFEISLKSYLQVSTSEWTLQGHRPDTLGHFTVNLSNVAQSATILYANSGYANLTTITNDVVNLSYLDPDDLYIKIDDNQSQKYQWISNIHPGETYNIDMASAQTPAFTSISLSGVYYEARIWGFKSTDFENSQPIMTNFTLGEVPAGNQIQVPLLAEHFPAYHTELKLIESWDSAASYTCRQNGDIPAAFQKINARIQSMAVHPSGVVEVHPGGDFTTANVTWQFYAHNNQIFTWTICGPDTTTMFRLPKLSSSLQQTFPTLSTDSLNFYNVELVKFPDLDSYDKFINAVFNPAHPRSQNKLNASTLILGQSK